MFKPGLIQVTPFQRISSCCCHIAHLLSVSSDLDTFLDSIGEIVKDATGPWIDFHAIQLSTVSKITRIKIRLMLTPHLPRKWTGQALLAPGNQVVDLPTSRMLKSVPQFCRLVDLGTCYAFHHDATLLGRKILQSLVFITLA